MNLEVTDIQQEYESVKAGAFPVVTAPATIPTGQAAVLPAWYVMEDGASPDEFVPCTTAANASAILPIEVDAQAAAVSALVYKTGEYRVGALSYDAAITTGGTLDAAAIAALEAKNIYVK